MPQRGRALLDTEEQPSLFCNAASSTLSPRATLHLLIEQQLKSLCAAGNGQFSDIALCLFSFLHSRLSFLISLLIEYQDPSSRSSSSVEREIFSYAAAASLHQLQLQLQQQEI